MRQSVVRIGYGALPWLLGGLVAAACSGSDEDAYTISYREKEPVRKPSSSTDASVEPDAFAGGGTGGAGNGCNPDFCQSSGAFQGCCTASGVCGVDYGFGFCSTLPPDAGFGTGGRRGTGGRPSREDAGRDAAEDAETGGRTSGGASGAGGHSTGGQGSEPDASTDASLD